MKVLKDVYIACPHVQLLPLQHTLPPSTTAQHSAAHLQRLQVRPDGWEAALQEVAVHLLVHLHAEGTDLMV